MSGNVLELDAAAADQPDGALALGFTLDAAHEAHQPPEASGGSRDDVRLLVSRGDEEPVHRTFRDVADELEPGDLLVVNTSATIAAAVDVRIPTAPPPAVIHVSTELPGGLWLVEPRRRLRGGSSEPLRLPPRSTQVLLGPPGGIAALDLLRPAPGSERLWLAAPAAGVDLPELLRRHGRAIRYPYVWRDWPLSAYQTVFATEPGSAEMPSAARPFTPEVVAALVRRGVGFATVTLHTGVSSLEGHEQPYSERFRVPTTTAALVNVTHAAGRRVVAVGTTAVRALETVADGDGHAHPGSGWTDVIVDPRRGVQLVDGLLTGWHEAAASHLAMLEAIAGRPALVAAYEAAYAGGYLWHEFGDSHLILPARRHPAPYAAIR